MTVQFLYQYNFYTLGILDILPQRQLFVIKTVNQWADFFGVSRAGYYTIVKPLEEFHLIEILANDPVEISIVLPFSKQRKLVNKTMQVEEKEWKEVEDQLK